MKTDWRHRWWWAAQVAPAVLWACGLAAGWVAPIAVAQAQGAAHQPEPAWKDTPSTREFRRRVLDLAVLYGQSSGVDENGDLIETTDLGPGEAGCRRVQALVRRQGLELAREVLQVCPPQPRE